MTTTNTGRKKFRPDLTDYEILIMALVDKLNEDGVYKMSKTDANRRNIMKTTYTLKNGNKVEIQTVWEKGYGAYRQARYTNFYEKKENGKYRLVYNEAEITQKFHNWKEQVVK